MSTLLTFLFAVALGIAFAYRNNNQRIELLNYRFDTERSDKANTLWHWWQGAVHALVMLSILGYCFYPPVWVDTFLFIAVYWVVFDNLLGYLINGTLGYLGGGKIDGFFKRWNFGEALKLAVQLLVIALITVAYNFV